MNLASPQNLPLSLAMRSLPLPQRALGNMLRLREGVSGLSHMTALQDTLVAWLPKSVLARTAAELTEGTLLELSETGLIYYGVPTLGDKLRRLFLKISPQSTRLSRESLSVPLRQLAGHQKSSAVSVKAALILASLGITLAGEYLVNYAKNLSTAHVFKKDRFSEVAGLSNVHSQQLEHLGHNFPTSQSPHVSQSPIIEKYRRRITQSLMAAGGMLGLGLLLSRFGGRVKPLQPVMEGLVKRFDFQYGANGRMGLGRNQMLAFMGLAVPGYLDACRDGLERAEVSTRLAIVLPYLAFGQPMLEKLMLRMVGKRFPDILDASGRVKTLATLQQEALACVNSRMGLPVGFSLEQAMAVGGERVAQAVAQELRQPIRAKMLLFGAPLLLGILGAGLGVGLLNRFWTAYRFRQGQRNNVNKPIRFPSSQFQQPRFEKPNAFAGFEQQRRLATRA